MKEQKKVENYTADQTAAMKARYLEAFAAGGYDGAKVVIEALAKEFSKTARSIVAKLTREQVYHAKEYKTKAGETPVKKDEHADAIGKVLGLSDGETDSLAKANKSALKKIFDALANSKPIDGNE